MPSFYHSRNNPNTGKLLGFSLIVSNTTDRNKGVVCYKDTHHTKSTIPPSFDIRCPVIGRYDTTTNDSLDQHTQRDTASMHSLLYVRSKFMLILSLVVLNRNPFCFSQYRRNLFHWSLFNVRNDAGSTSSSLYYVKSLCFIHVLATISISINIFVPKLRIIPRFSVFKCPTYRNRFQYTAQN